MQNRIDKIASRYQTMQSQICRTLEKADGGGSFVDKHWTREVGYGRSSVLQSGAIIEKGGVNFSRVEGLFTSELEKFLGVSANSFRATGISSILHPVSPYVPIIHMNVRFFELDNGISWFGGGIDLTPHYIMIDEALTFHKGLKELCDAFSPRFYNDFKAWADDYFFLPHRNETRGIGGIFFDRINPKDYGLAPEEMLEFTLQLAIFFPKFYSRSMTTNGHLPCSEKEKQWQSIRRSRYVEFNLLYDRGTKFGLETNGNTESILVSMPPHACWIYDHVPEKNSREATTLKWLRKDIDWINME